MLSISYSLCDSLSVITSYTTKIKGKPVHCAKAQVMNLNVWFTAQQSAWGWGWWLITSRVYTVTLKGWFWRTRNLDRLTSVQNRCRDTAMSSQWNINWREYESRTFIARVLTGVPSKNSNHTRSFNVSRYWFWLYQRQWLEFSSSILQTLQNTF